MTYEWRFNIETNRWSYEEVAFPAPLPDASWTLAGLREFKLRVMDALDHETRLELRAFKLRRELHMELSAPIDICPPDCPECAYDDDPTAC